MSTLTEEFPLTHAQAMAALLRVIAMAILESARRVEKLTDQYEIGTTLATLMKELDDLNVVVRRALPKES